MTKHSRWVAYDVAMLVRVEVDDEVEDDRVSQVVLSTGLDDPDGFGPLALRTDGIELSRDLRGHFQVYDGAADAEMAPINDRWAEQAIRIAEDRRAWPARSQWEEGADPRIVPGLYDDIDDDGDEDDELDWSPL